MKKLDIFTSGQDGYHTYRIPSLIVAPNGDLLAFCEGRRNSRSDHGDLDLMLKRSEDGGETWSAQQVVYGEEGEITIGNPCPVVDMDTGTVWLPFCRDNDEVLITCSIDDGTTWTEPEEITREVKDGAWTWYAAGPGVGIQLRHGEHRGRLVIPCDHRAPDTYNNGSHTFYSDDHGESWQLGGAIQPGANECQVVELDDGRLVMNIRMQEFNQGHRGVACSDDGGETWAELRHDEGLPCPICQASFVGSRDYLLFSNPVPPGEAAAGRGERVNTTVRLSEDEGDTWPVARLLHEGPGAYSCLCVLPEGEIGCLYEAGSEHAYEHLVFAKFPRGWLEEGQTG